MLRTDIINLLIKKINAKKYLEIGISDGINFSKINCEYKLGVDPNIESPATYHTTSDKFFEKNIENFDVIFIDGLHHADQVYRDILNSLDVLNDGGYIVCHDMNPQEEEHQVIPFNGGFWNGDCWKSFVQLKRERSDLEMYVIDTDCGCGIIKKGKQNILIGNQKLTWQNFKINRKYWLNLISVNEFMEKMSNSIEHIDNELINTPEITLQLNQDNKNGFWKFNEDKTLKEAAEYIKSTYHQHYTSEESKVQVLDIIESIGDGVAFCRDNLIKYSARFGKKEGFSKLDALKIIHYGILMYHFAGFHKNTDNYETF